MQIAALALVKVSKFLRLFVELQIQLRCRTMRHRLCRSRHSLCESRWFMKSAMLPRDTKNAKTKSACVSLASRALKLLTEQYIDVAQSRVEIMS